VELKRLISLIWILINSHYGISKKRYTYFHQKRRLWELFLIVFAIVALAVSAVPLYGFFTKALLDQYIILGMEHLFLANLMLLSSVIGFVFGTFLLVSTFFFSNEMRILLPLPLKPYEVLIGKFAVVLLDQMIISLALLLPGFVYYGLRTSVHVSYWIVSLSHRYNYHFTFVPDIGFQKKQRFSHLRGECGCARWCYRVSVLLRECGIQGS